MTVVHATPIPIYVVFHTLIKQFGSQSLTWAPIPEPIYQMVSVH